MLRQLAKYEILPSVRGAAGTIITSKKEYAQPRDRRGSL
jgi:hypothetical protein